MTTSQPAFGVRETTWHVPVDGTRLAGTLSAPADSAAAPAVLLIGGTLSDTRDGDVDPRTRPGVPPHGMYRRLAHALARAGLASFRFDRRGSGENEPGPRPDRATEIADAAAVWAWLDRHGNVSGAQAMVGESAGAYVLCRLAAEGLAPKAAVLQGALHRSIPEMIAWNYGRARDFIGRGDAERQWLARELPIEYQNGVLVDAMLAALDAGDRTVRVEHEGVVYERSLAGLDYDLRHAPADQFAHLTCPVLVIHGAEDMNVPVEDAFATIATLWRAGNRSVDLTILAGADHSFQLGPDDPEDRLRERLTLRSFGRPFHPAYPAPIVDFLARHLTHGGPTASGAR
ncbi:MAG TPA: alpha/beta fold hydrolase [Candidatus Limnocylindrales bacterium]|nr:alpha/beta fold hydrolase [Candidatus Limnocylindrales bacterium]